MEINVRNRKIWWIASYPKSGNTWVRMFINAYLTGFPLDINSGFQYVLGDNNSNVFQICSPRPYMDLTEVEQVFLRPAVLIHFLTLSTAQHVCLKTHHARVNVDDIPLIPASMSAGGVYIIRDPRDIVISFADHMAESIDDTIKFMNTKEYVLKHNKTNLIHVLTTWSLHVQTWTDKNNKIPITIVKYEDMLANPEGAFRVILKALGFDTIDEDKFEFAIKETRFSNLQAIEAKTGFREKGQGQKFFRKGEAGQWKGVLTANQIRQIEEDHKEVMRKFGYNPVKISRVA